MQKIITLLFWKRPQYAQVVLDHLSKCDGIEDYKLLIHIDGNGHPDMPYVAASVDFCELVIVCQPAHLGCNEMTSIALNHGFNESDYVIHVEEDVVLAPDSLRFFEWARQFGTDRTVFNVAALKLPKAPTTPKVKAEGNVEKDWSFHCWGWATWKDRWMEMDKNWTHKGDMDLSWDVHLNEVRSWRNGSELMPHVSRSNNIGKDGGIHRGDSMLPYWAGSPGFVPPTEYRLIT